MTTPPLPPLPPLLSIAVDAVRAWTRLYTWRLPPALRDARRAEIESDLWESVHDRARAASAWAKGDDSVETHPPTSVRHSSTQILGRLIVGIPDDLAWSAEHRAATTRPMTPRTVALTGALTAIVAAVLLAVLWVMPLLTPGELPTPRPLRAFVEMPPPPPPPPPPCPPPALGGCKS